MNTKIVILMLSIAIMSNLSFFSTARAADYYYGGYLYRDGQWGTLALDGVTIWEQNQGGQRTYWIAEPTGPIWSNTVPVAEDDLCEVEVQSNVTVQTDLSWFSSSEGKQPTGYEESQTRIEGKAQRLQNNGLCNVLVNDWDEEDDNLVLESLDPMPGNQGTVVVDVVSNQIIYTPPQNVSQEYADRFEYQVHDNHGGEARAFLDVLVTLGVTETCDRIVGGSGCFGQALDETWFTLEEELSGITGGRSLFQDLDLLDEDFSLAIVTSPGTESYWGCPGSSLTPARSSIFQCRSGSLKRRTYAMRIYIVNGAVPNYISVIPGMAESDHLSWTYVVADQPYDVSLPAPPGVDSCEKRGKASTSFAAGSCNVMADARNWTGTRYLYLMMRPDGANSERCGTGTYQCRMYVHL